MWSIASRFAPLPADALVEIVPNVSLAIRGDEHVGRMIYKGGYERAEKSVLVHLLPRGGLAVDVGANIGFYTAWMAHLVGASGRVLAFEPSLDRFAALQRNITKANLSQVSLHRLALGAEPGHAQLVNPGGRANAGQGTLRLEVSEEITGTRVPVARLDDHLVNDEVVDFVKIDVEGYEAEVLVGARKLFMKQRVRFALLELSPEFGDTTFISNFLSTNGSSYRSFFVRMKKGLVRWHPEAVPVRPSEIATQASQTSILLAHTDELVAVERIFSPSAKRSCKKMRTSTC